MNSRLKKPFVKDMIKNKKLSNNKISNNLNTNNKSDAINVLKIIIKHSRKSGVLNLSGRCLEEGMLSLIVKPIEKYIKYE